MIVSPAKQGLPLACDRETRPPRRVRLEGKHFLVDLDLRLQVCVDDELDHLCQALLFVGLDRNRDGDGLSRVAGLFGEVHTTVRFLDLLVRLHFADLFSWPKQGGSETSGLRGEVKSGWYSNTYLYYMLDFLIDVLVIEEVMFLHYELQDESELVLAYYKDGTFLHYRHTPMNYELQHRFFNQEKD